MKTLLPALLFVLLAPSSALAAWPHDPNANVALCQATGDQNGAVGVSDGAGGAIFSWVDSRTANGHIYVQRVSAAGVPLWTADGVLLSTATGAELSQAIIPDGAGGAIVAYQDVHGSFYDVYAQRVNANGVVQWAAGGQPISQAANNQITPKLISDGAGGAIITWSDVRNGSTSDIYAQRVNGAGAPQWTIDGVPICVAANNQQSPALCSDNAGGAIITWQDLRTAGNADIYAQRVNASGVVQWTTDGVVVCNATTNQAGPQIISDGANGAIVTWIDPRNGTDTDIYAQKLASTGGALWTANGVGVALLAQNQSSATLATDGEGGAIIAWADSRAVSFSNIFAQHLNTAGNATWAANGVAVAATSFGQVSPAIVADGSGGAFVSWSDSRSGSNADIYAQHLNASGASTWAASGLGVCTVNLAQGNASLMRDGVGGVILGWEDDRALTSYDIYAQRVDPFGYLGNPEPVIGDVGDVPNDQGGKVKVSFYPSYLDGLSDPNLAAYDVYRSAPSAVALAAARSGARVVSSFGERPQSGARAFVMQPSGAQLYAWEYLATVTPTHFLSAYGVIAPTTGDSTALGNPPTIFMVVGRNASGSMYWLSAPDSGYSADNLAPVAPAPFTADYLAGATHLHWGANHEGDLAGYRLYRGSAADFVPGPGNLVVAQTDTGYVDVGDAGSFYKLSAVDIHGNESLFALVTPGSTTAVGPGGPRELALALASANPAHGETKFRFALPTACTVRLALFDLAGREVRVLVNGAVPAGDGSARWDGRDAAGHEVASGAYIARLSVPGRELRTRVMMLR